MGLLCTALLSSSHTMATSTIESTETPLSVLLQSLHGSADDGRSWSGSGESASRTVQTTALPRSSLQSETRSLTRVVGENSGRQKAWDDYLNSYDRTSFDTAPPPPDELCNPIRYFVDRSVSAREQSLDGKGRTKSHSVDPLNSDTCKMMLHVNNTLYRLDRDTNHRIVAKHAIERFDDEGSRECKMAALLHSLQGQGHRRKPLKELHAGFMKSLIAADRGEIDFRDYHIDLGHASIGGEEKYTSFARSKYPDSTGTVYHVDVEFYDDKVSGLRSS